MAGARKIVALFSVPLCGRSYQRRVFGARLAPSLIHFLAYVRHEALHPVHKLTSYSPPHEMSTFERETHRTPEQSLLHTHPPRKPNPHTVNMVNLADGVGITHATPTTNGTNRTVNGYANGNGHSVSRKRVVVVGLGMVAVAFMYAHPPTCTQACVRGQCADSRAEKS